MTCIHFLGGRVLKEHDENLDFVQCTCQSFCRCPFVLLEGCVWFVFAFSLAIQLQLISLWFCKRLSSIIQMKWCSLEQTYSKFVREYPRLSNMFRMMWHLWGLWRTFVTMTQKLLPFPALNFAKWRILIGYVMIIIHDYTWLYWINKNSAIAKEVLTS